MSKYRFLAQALTPVHVGCGQVMDPSQFLVRENDVLQFSPVMVLGDLSQEERSKFLAIADRGDFVELQRFFRRHCDPDRHGLGRIPIGNAVRRELELKLGNPANRFEIQLMPRNSVSGRLFLPGSGLKGAIRTAVVNHFTNCLPEVKPLVHRAVAGAETRDKARALEEAALNRRRSETERDVFRLIDVIDAELPPQPSRIDRAYNWNPKKSGSDRIQMWVERLLSRADSPNSPEFTVDIDIDLRAMAHPKVSGQLGRKLDMKTIAAACNHFYWGRLVAERNRFFPTLQGKLDDSTRMIYKTMANIWPTTDDGKKQIGAPVWPYILLRIGRFCQFESLSVDELRQGHRPQAKDPAARVIRDMGATRNLCDMGPGRPEMPFGWVLLRLA